MWIQVSLLEDLPNVGLQQAIRTSMSRAAHVPSSVLKLADNIRLQAAPAKAMFTAIVRPTLVADIDKANSVHRRLQTDVASQLLCHAQNATAALHLTCWRCAEPYDLPAIGAGALLVENTKVLSSQHTDENDWFPLKLYGAKPRKLRLDIARCYDEFGHSFGQEQGMQPEPAVT
eukprot:CAMPEP_0117530502 /NCGR_PEP_ID=MMETSP0784-20121206/38377_1 /TAXON_ID=39447 /ORGANISM="" /LENGTH=173 /DNA_ID=CAMNT_0005326849 /DNA_START=1156 /DNA_END=1673 /DNA_ORIENTATION=-